MAVYSARQDVARTIVSAIEKSFSDERAARTPDARPHVSELVHCLRQSWRKRQPGYAEGPRSDPENMTLLRGMAWDAIADRVASAPDTVPCAHTGIDTNCYHAKVKVETPYMIGEADAVAIIDDHVTVIDNKTTAAGPNGTKTASGDAPLRWPHYVEQVAAYCVGLGYKYAALSILHLPMPTTFRVWRLSFSSEELLRWAVELQRRAAVVTSDVEPDVTECAAWERKYCGFYEGNGGDCPCSPGRAAGFFPLDSLQGVA